MKSGRDQMVIDPDPDEIYTKRKKRIVNVMLDARDFFSLNSEYADSFLQG